MNSQEIIARLKAARTSAPRVGRRPCHPVRLAPGVTPPDSDTDFMIELDPAVPIGVWDYVGTKEYIEGLFEGRIDVVNRDGLKPYVRSVALADSIYAF